MDQEWIGERAAILEFEGGYSRRYAETQAVEMWRRYCKDMNDFEEKKGKKWQAD